MILAQAPILPVTSSAKIIGFLASVRNVELMAQCSDCLFEGWNETYADPLPMEFADGKTRLTHVVAALSMTDQQEADKLLGDPLSCHVCTVPDSHYLTPEVTFPVKTAPSVLKKVLDAAGGKILQQPRLLIGRSPEGHRIWLGQMRPLLCEPMSWGWSA